MRGSDLTNKGRESFTAFAPLILWIAVIFFLSSALGSVVHTSRFIRPVLVFLFPSADDITIEFYHAYVRKAAHFTEYGVLAIFAIRALGRTAAGIFSRYRFAAALILVAVVACLDELNQSFEPSRTGSFRDVALDVSGGLTLIIVLMLVRRFRDGAVRDGFGA